VIWPRGLLLLLCCYGQVAWAQTLHFGTNRLAPGQVVEFSASPGAAARWEASSSGRVPPTVRGAFLLPRGCTNLIRPCPLLITSVPSGGSAIRSLYSLTNLAWTEGWAILAADGPKIDANDDTVQWGWGILASALEKFSATWPPAKRWPVVCAGFSGGAKRSAAVAAAMTHEGWRVIGVFMGGCNEDRASLGVELFHPPAQFKQVPMYLSNGTDDPIANAQHGAAVKESMTRAGFVNVRLETYPGRHQLNQDELRNALRWFLQLAGSLQPLPR